MKRVFIAIKIELAPELQQAWQKLKCQLKDEKVRWVPQENLHITLRFLGSISSEQVEQVKICLQEIGEQQSSFSFLLGNFSYFKRRGKPAVVFLDLQEEDVLRELVTTLNKKLAELDFPDIPKFRPHLTLGRIKHLQDESAFLDILERSKETSQQLVQVNEIIFYESILKPEGPEYKILEKYSLQ